MQGSRGGYKGEKLSLNFQNVEVRAVLQVIADFTGLNIITSDTVQGNLTLRLKDVPWDQALDIILQTKGLDMRKNGNVVLIAPREELALKEKLQLENAGRRSASSSRCRPNRSSSTTPRPQDILNLVTATASSSSGRARADGDDGGQGSSSQARHRDHRPAHQHPVRARHRERARGSARIIRQIDTPMRQVLIEARIVIASDKFSRQLGVRFGQQTGFTFNNAPYPRSARAARWTRSRSCTRKATGSSATRARRRRSSSRPGLPAPGYSDSPQLNVNLPVTNAAGQLALTLINLGSGNLINLELSALEADNRGKVVSSPRVVTADNQKAQIEQGTEIPYVTPGSANSPATVQFKKAVLRLDVTPQITPDNRIIMTVEIRKDTVGQFVQLGGGFSVPSIDTKNVTTQIAVNNGDTAVIGGIYEETIRNDITQVPLLGDIPVLGYLFKQTARSSEKTELLIFLTPRIVASDHRGQSSREGRAAAPVVIPAQAGIQVRKAAKGHDAAMPPPRRQARIPRCHFTAAISFSSACRAPASPRSGASSRGGSRKRFVDADHELEQRLGVSIPTIFEIEGEAGFRDREEAMHRGARRRNGHRARRPAAAPCCDREPCASQGERHRALPACRPDDALAARAPRPQPAAAAHGGSARALAELYALRDPLYREVADHRRRIGARRRAAVRARARSGGRAAMTPNDAHARRGAGRAQLSDPHRPRAARPRARAHCRRRRGPAGGDRHQPRSSRRTTSRRLRAGLRRRRDRRAR